MYVWNQLKISKVIAHIHSHDFWGEPKLEIDRREKIIISEDFASRIFIISLSMNAITQWSECQKWNLHTLFDTLELAPHSSKYWRISRFGRRGCDVMGIGQWAVSTYKFIIFLFDAVIISLEIVAVAVRVTFVFIRSTLQTERKKAAVKHIVLPNGICS